MKQVGAILLLVNILSIIQTCNTIRNNIFQIEKKAQIILCKLILASKGP